MDQLSDLIQAKYLIWGPQEAQRWRWPFATSPNAKIFAMWRKICDVFSHSGEDKNEMILSRFRGKSRLKNDCITIVFLHDHGFIWFFKFSIDLASIFQYCRSINKAIIAYIIDYIQAYIQHKLCLFTFSTKNKMADDHGVHLFLWSVRCFIYNDHVMFIMSLYHSLCVMSYFVAAFNNLCFTFYYYRAIAMD